jgi:hypothetical protein
MAVNNITILGSGCNGMGDCDDHDDECDQTYSVICYALRPQRKGYINVHVHWQKRGLA